MKIILVKIFRRKDEGRNAGTCKEEFVIFTGAVQPNVFMQKCRRVRWCGCGIHVEL
jgi:hypothetical protein